MFGKLDRSSSFLNLKDWDGSLDSDALCVICLIEILLFPLRCCRIADIFTCQEACGISATFAVKNEEERAAGGGAIHPGFHYLESRKSSGGLKGTDGVQGQIPHCGFL